MYNYEGVQKSRGYQTILSVTTTEAVEGSRLEILEIAEHGE